MQGEGCRGKDAAKQGPNEPLMREYGSLHLPNGPHEPRGPRKVCEDFKTGHPKAKGPLVTLIPSCNSAKACHLCRGQLDSSCWGAGVVLELESFRVPNWGLQQAGLWFCSLHGALFVEAPFVADHAFLNHEWKRRCCRRSAKPSRHLKRPVQPPDFFLSDRPRSRAVLPQ